MLDPGISDFEKKVSRKGAKGAKRQRRVGLYFAPFAPLRETSSYP
jgi:hypothetical protein